MDRIQCPRCRGEMFHPVEGLSQEEAHQRLLIPFAVVGVVMLWALLYLTLPVLITIIGGSVHWVMTLIVAAMWPLAGVVMIVAWQAVKARMMSPGLACDRCQTRIPHEGATHA